MSSPPKKDRVFIDTNIFVYHFSPVHDTCHTKAGRFFTDVEKQQKIGITASYTKTEYAGVINRLIAKRTGSAPNRRILDAVMNSFDKFIAKMGIEYYDTDTLARSDNALFSDAYERVMSAVAVQKSNGEWKSLTGADSIILTCAERSNSDFIITNDSGFQGTSSNVKPMMLEVAY